MKNSSLNGQKISLAVVCMQGDRVQSSLYLQWAFLYNYKEKSVKLVIYRLKKMTVLTLKKLVKDKNEWMVGQC